MEEGRMEKTTGESSARNTPQKTAEDDHDEEDWDTTLKTYKSPRSDLSKSDATPGHSATVTQPAKSFAWSRRT